MAWNIFSTRSQRAAAKAEKTNRMDHERLDMAIALEDFVRACLTVFDEIEDIKRGREQYIDPSVFNQVGCPLFAFPLGIEWREFPVKELRHSERFPKMSRIAEIGSTAMRTM